MYITQCKNINDENQFNNLVDILMRWKGQNYIKDETLILKVLELLKKYNNKGQELLQNLELYISNLDNDTLSFDIKFFLGVPGVELSLNVQENIINKYINLSLGFGNNYSEDIFNIIKKILLNTDFTLNINEKNYLVISTEFSNKNMSALLNILNSIKYSYLNRQHTIINTQL